MTPTLYGRWQTRFLLMMTVGVFFTCPFILFGVLPVINWFLVLTLGFFWDVIYQFLQKLRWDRDWPPAFQAFAGLWEAFVILLIDLFILQPLLGLTFNFWVFFFHYGFIWWASFLLSQGPFRVLFIRWRYRGGQLL